MKHIRQLRITRTEQRTVRVLHVPESGAAETHVTSNQPTRPKGWKRLLAWMRGGSRNLAPGLAMAMVCAVGSQAQTVLLTVVAHEITALPGNKALANVNNGGVPKISRNGNRIAFVTQDPAGGLDLDVINADGTGQRQLANSNNTLGDWVDISDDGTLVAWGSSCCRSTTLSLYAADGSSSKNLLSLQGGYFYNPRITGDNSKIFFVIDRDTLLADNTPMSRGVWSINTNGSGLKQIVTAASAASALGLTAGQVPYLATGLDRSSDGSHLVFSVLGTPTGMAILGANGDGSQVHPILKNVQYLNQLYITPDGTKVSYNMHPNPFGQPNQIAVVNFDGTGTVTLANNFSDDSYPMQFTGDGSQLLVGAGRLYRTDGSGFLTVSASGVNGNFTGDPPTILYNGTFAGTINSAGSRIEYLANDANNQSQIIVMDLNPASTGAAPVISKANVTPDFVLVNYLSSATETVTVTPGNASVYRVSSVTLVNGVPDNSSGGDVFEGVLFDDGTHGDAVKNDLTYTNNGVTADSIATLGTRIIMFRAEAKAADGKRHATGQQIAPFSVLKTAPYTFTVAASTPGLTVVVDGTAYSAPQQFLWDAGDSHSLTAPSPQTYQGKTYTFNNWSDNNTQTHTITAPGANTTYTAIFTASGGGCGNSPFVGTFNTSLGVLTVTQNPNCSLTGTISGGPTFTGTVSSSTWSGTFTGPTGSGTFTFTASGGGITGPYTFTAGSGTSGNLTTNSGGCGTNPFVGSFNTALGSLTVSQAANCTLTGTIPGGPTFTGTSTGNTWTGTFTTSTGGGTFTFTASGGSFTGTYTYTSGTGNNGSLTASSGGTNPNCAYNFPSTAGVPTALNGAGYNSLLFSLQTAPTCTWSVAAVDSWIHILVPTPNTTVTGGSGVSVLLEANPSSTLARTGTVTVTWPGGSGSNLVTQAAGPSCTFTMPVTSTPTNISAAGGASSFAFNASPTACLWTASTPNPDWITITNPNGPTPVNFKVAANGAYPAPARQGKIVVQGQTFTVNQDAAASPNAPVITPGGVANAASYASASPPNGGIAQGSYISIFGTGLGPATFAQAAPFANLTPSLAGVSIKITNGATSVDVLPTFVQSAQINAIVPSNTPLGTGAMTVTYNGATSASTPVVIVPNALGIFTVGNTSQGIIQTFPGTAPIDQRPLNSSTSTAAVGDYGLVWATGIGANILGGKLQSDSAPPTGGQMDVPVTVTIDGLPASVPYSGRAPGFNGVDNIYFIIPPGVHSSCNISVKIQAGSLPANVVTIAVDANRQTCQN